VFSRREGATSESITSYSSISSYALSSSSSGLKKPRSDTLSTISTDSLSDIAGSDHSPVTSAASSVSSTPVRGNHHNYNKDDIEMNNISGGGHGSSSFCYECFLNERYNDEDEDWKEVLMYYCGDLLADEEDDEIIRSSLETTNSNNSASSEKKDEEQSTSTTTTCSSGNANQETDIKTPKKPSSLMITITDKIFSNLEY
jgi:hypothetical protein